MTSYTAADTSSPTEPNRTVTAFFDTRDAADKARADLIAAGISPDTVSVLGGDAVDTASGAQEGGFWHALKELFVPDEDKYTYAEGLRRGGFTLSVRTSETDYDRTIDILDADGAVDIDEREQDWRAEGWTGYRPDSTQDLGFETGWHRPGRARPAQPGFPGADRLRHGQHDPSHADWPAGRDDDEQRGRPRSDGPELYDRRRCGRGRAWQSDPFGFGSTPHSFGNRQHDSERDEPEPG